MSRTRFTPETRSRLLEHISAGLSITDSCRAVGIGHKTVRNWLSRGRKENTGPYVDFACAVDEARKRALPEPMTEDQLRRVVSQAAKKGSVQAQKLYWEMILDDRSADEAEKEETKPLESIDELAERRAAA